MCYQYQHSFLWDMTNSNNRCKEEVLRSSKSHKESISQIQLNKMYKCWNQYMSNNGDLGSNRVCMCERLYHDMNLRNNGL